MLAPEQLAAIKARLLEDTEGLRDAVHEDTRLYHSDIRGLLAELERLTRHNQRMSAALAQLSDKENWLDQGAYGLLWKPHIDPQQLAERALVEDN